MLTLVSGGDEEADEEADEEEDDAGCPFPAGTHTSQNECTKPHEMSE